MVDIIHDLSIVDENLKLGNTGIELCLLALGFVIFAVFRQVAEAAGFLDLLSILFDAVGLQVIEFLFERVITLLAHLEAVHIGHVKISFSVLNA